MPKLSRSVPRLCKRTVNGIAYAAVWIGGKPIYCGHWGTRAARAEYDRIIGEWLNAGRPRRLSEPGDQVTVSQLCAAFWRHAKSYYHKSNVTHFRIVIRALRKRYGHTFTADFGPRALKTIRQALVDGNPSKKKRGACRKYANQQTQQFGIEFAQTIWAILGFVRRNFMRSATSKRRAKRSNKSASASQ